MSKLLMDEHPIQVMPTLASHIGLNEAIILQQMHYWLSKSNHDHDGRKWIYNTVKGWAEQFPFWSESTIKRAINNLTKKELVVIGNYNKAKFDKTLWYSIDYDKLDELERVNNRLGQNELTSSSKRPNGESHNDQTNESDCSNGESHNDQTNESDCSNGEVQIDQTNTIDYTETTTENTQETTPPEKKTVAAETEEFKKLYNYFEQNINMHQAIKVVNFITEDLEKFGFDLVMYAMEQALLNNKTHYAYIQGVLRRCEAENVTTREQAEFKAMQKKSNYNNNQSKEITPKWINDETRGSVENIDSEVTLEMYLDAKKDIYQSLEMKWTQSEIDKYTAEYYERNKKGA